MKARLEVYLALVFSMPPIVHNFLPLNRSFHPVFARLLTHMPEQRH